jgi:hypothetical protein
MYCNPGFYGQEGPSKSPCVPSAPSMGCQVSRPCVSTCDAVPTTLTLDPGRPPGDQSRDPAAAAWNRAPDHRGGHRHALTACSKISKQRQSPKERLFGFGSSHLVRPVAKSWKLTSVQTTKPFESVRYHPRLILLPVVHYDFVTSLYTIQRQLKPHSSTVQPNLELSSTRGDTHLVTDAILNSCPPPGSAVCSRILHVRM